jgi:hypothetical protein
VLDEHKWAVPGQLAARSGVRLNGSMTGTPGDKAAMYEVVVDQMDLLN